MSEFDNQADRIAELVVRVYDLHEVVIKESGGMEGLRDGAMLRAAVARPFATFAGEDLYPDDFEKTAALFHSLIKSHPFMDGTKRTAFLSALYFLENRGYTIPDHFPKDEVIRFCLAVVEENAQQSENAAFQPISVAEIAAWFRQLLAPQEPTSPSP
jgi:death-on-curing protein